MTTPKVDPEEWRRQLRAAELQIRIRCAVRRAQAKRKQRLFEAGLRAEAMQIVNMHTQTGDTYRLFAPGWQF